MDKIEPEETRKGLIEVLGMIFIQPVAREIGVKIKLVYPEDKEQ